MRWAYLGRPHVGGTHTVMRMLRAGMAEQGTLLRWVGVEPRLRGIADDPAWAHEMPLGEVVPVDEDTPAGHTRALVRHLETAGYDGVLVNVLTTPGEMCVPRHLSPRVQRLAIVHNITPATYTAAAEIAPHVGAVVGVSPRISRDLQHRHRVKENRSFTVPNAIDIEPYQSTDPPRPGRPMRLLFLGRIEDAQKGVFWLPAIMKALEARVDATLTIAGDGEDMAELRRRCEPLGERVRFLGRVDPSRVPALAADHHVLLMPSRYEGFGYTLVEAMAGGCVPVASRIHGVSDFVVQDGRSGLLFGVGRTGEAANCIERLDHDPELWRRLSEAARQRALQDFSASRMGRAYLDVAQRTRGLPPTAEPLPLDQWRLPAGFGPGLRRFIPPTIKNWLRPLLAR